MCGIAGIYAYHYAANPVDHGELGRIRDHMALRGPDGAGEWYSPNQRVGFGHRRLSIIDLSEAGSQPMKSADGNLVVTFNGEIYNYKELRRALEMKGYHFRTQSDTEVLLQLYADQGEAMVHHLRGMFAFGLWDARKNALLLARDPYGIKPLYYADDGWTLRFASQVKALLAGQNISRDPEPAGWVGFYLLGSVPEPYTTYQQIRSVPAGSFLWVDRVGVRKPKQFFSLAKVYRDAEPSSTADAKTDQAVVRQALLDSVRHHLVADVPVGAFLSSGIDSGALVGLMRDAGQRDIQTVTLAFDEFKGTQNDESVMAAQIAAQYGTRHTTRYVTEREFGDDLPKILEAMDLPTIDGLNTWFVSKAARELGLKVAISGLGGDELFGSYPSFRQVPRYVRATAVAGHLPIVGKLSRWLLTRGGMPRTMNPKGAGILEYGGSYAGAYLLKRGLFMPWELGAVMDSDMVRRGLERLNLIPNINEALRPRMKSAFGKIAVLEASFYMRNQLLRDTDWASMAHSLEVRVPLVDATLLRDLAKVTSRIKAGSKRILGNSPSVPLPSEVLRRPKTGFHTPIQDWLQRDRRIERWRRVPKLADDHCSWARRWAYHVATV
jgi:asparagine synthase (glutamine-hydrolysing)